MRIAVKRLTVDGKTVIANDLRGMKHDTKHEKSSGDGVVASGDDDVFAC